MRFLLLMTLVVGALAAVAPWNCTAGEKARSHPIGVVELFTSQGCSSCPKADAAFAELAEREDLISISYHIDYWNYLGWQDTLAVKENTDRQYGYAKMLGNNNVFTPQIVLNGVRDARSANLRTILDDLHSLARAGDGVPVGVDAELMPDELVIRIAEGAGKADVVIAYFQKMTTVDIAKGENIGKKITYRNAVTNLETVGMWEGKPLEIKLPSSLIAKRGHDGCAILLQAHDRDGNPGRIYGAAMIENYRLLAR